MIVKPSLLHLLRCSIIMQYWKSFLDKILSFKANNERAANNHVNSRNRTHELGIKKHPPSYQFESLFKVIWQKVLHKRGGKLESATLNPWYQSCAIFFFMSARTENSISPKYIVANIMSILTLVFLLNINSVLHY